MLLSPAPWWALAHQAWLDLAPHTNKVAHSQQVQKAALPITVLPLRPIALGPGWQLLPHM